MLPGRFGLLLPGRFALCYRAVLASCYRAVLLFGYRAVLASCYRAVGRCYKTAVQSTDLRAGWWEPNVHGSCAVLVQREYMHPRNMHIPLGNLKGTRVSSKEA